MSTPRLRPLAALALGAAAALSSFAAPRLVAQSQVVPALAANVEGNSIHAYPLSFSQGRLQALLEFSTLGPVRALRSIAFRPDGGGTTNSYAATRLPLRLTLHQVATSAGSMSTTWASNLGSSTGTLVFQGTLNLPAFATSYPLPNPFAVSVPFQTPFIVQATAGNLLLDWVGTDSNAVFQRFNVDAVSYPRTPGSLVTRVWQNSSCESARRDRLKITMGRTTGVLGSNIDIMTQAQPGGTGKLDVLLLMMGSNNKSFGSVALPVPLGAAHPSCALAIDPLFIFPAAPIPLPNDPRLANFELYFQGLAADSATGDFVVSQDAWSIRLLDNPPKAQAWQSVYRSSYTNQTTGYMSTGFFYAPVIKLNG